MWLVDYILTRSWTGAGKITLKYLVPLSFGELPPPGRSPRRRGRDLHQTKPEDRRVHPAGRLRVGHGRVRRPRLRISHGPHQLPAFYFPGLHTPPGEYDPPTSRCYTHRLFLGPVAHKHRGVVLSCLFFFFFLLSFELFSNGVLRCWCYFVNNRDAVLFSLFPPSHFPWPPANICSLYFFHTSLLKCRCWKRFTLWILSWAVYMLPWWFVHMHGVPAVTGLYSCD